MGRLEGIANHIGAVNWHAVKLYRLSRQLHEANHRASASLVAAINRVLTGVEIPPTAVFGDGLIIMHGHGIVVHPRVLAGRDCVLFQQVTLGSRSIEGRPPRLGDGVVIYPGAKVLGDISIGEKALIGANAVVVRDVAAGAVMVAPSARPLDPTSPSSSSLGGP